MTLESYRQNGWLNRHQSSPEEIRNLLGVADTKLSDCKKAKELSADSRLLLAHNSIMASAAAVLAAAGYRAARGGGGEHYQTIQALEFTIDPKKQLIQRIDTLRKKRNQSAYEVSGSVSDMEAERGFALALQVRGEVEKWIKTHHPEMLR